MLSSLRFCRIVKSILVQKGIYHDHAAVPAEKGTTRESSAQKTHNTKQRTPQQSAQLSDTDDVDGGSARMRARVGAMPQPKGIHHDQPSSRGGNRARVHSGMSLEVSAGCGLLHRFHDVVSGLWLSDYCTDGPRRTGPSRRVSRTRRRCERRDCSVDDRSGLHAAHGHCHCN